MDKQIKVKGMRKIIAERMSESWNTSPRVVYTVSVDMLNVMQFREEINKKSQDIKVSLNHILMSVCANALKEFPYVNSSFENETITIHDNINIGLAVALEDGLIVPNLKNVQNKDLATIAKETNKLVKNARNMKISMDDVTGGTFTITNLGMMGIESFSPIINQPEVAILGVNKMVKTPVCVDDEVVVRPIMKLNLVADHRVIDGAYAAMFIGKIKNNLENPFDED